MVKIDEILLRRLYLEEKKTDAEILKEILQKIIQENRARTQPDRDRLKNYIDRFTKQFPEQPTQQVVEWLCGKENGDWTTRPNLPNDQLILILQMLGTFEIDYITKFQNDCLKMVEIERGNLK